MSLLDNMESRISKGFGENLNPGTPRSREDGTPMKRSEIFIDDMKIKGIDMTSMLDLFRCNGNVQVQSCAGSGKTTSLIHKVLYDVLTGTLTEVREVNGRPFRFVKKAWVSTFLNAASNELRIRAKSLARTYRVEGDLSPIKFSTLHSEFKSALESLGFTLSVLSDSKKNETYLRGVLKGVIIDRGLNSEQFNNLVSALSYTRNRLDKQRYVTEIYNELKLTPSVIDMILDKWQHMRRINSQMDFEDMQDYLYTFGVVQKDSRVIDLLASRYSALYIDEFQDVSQIQYEILKVYASDPNTRIMTIGDDDQTIYTWRGSSNDIITERFANDFNPEVVSLDVNYRCPSEILNPIIPSIILNENRLEKSIKAKNEGGEFYVGGFANYGQMVDVLIKGVRKDVAEGKTVAILVRTNQDGLAPAVLMDKYWRELNYSVSGTGMTLDNYMGGQILAIANIITDRVGKGLIKALGSLGWGMGREAEKLISSGLKPTGMSIWDINPENLDYSCPGLAPHIHKWREVRATMPNEVNFLKYLITYFRDTAYKNHNSFNDQARLLCDAVLNILEAQEYGSVREFTYELGEVSERLKARKKMDGANVWISTIHDFKGREADSVYVWDDSDGVFPSKRSDISDQDQLEEERRVHYIACTRAREIQTIIYRKGQAGMFLGEMDMSRAKDVRERLGINEQSYALK